MIEALLAACTTIQVEATGNGPSTVWRVDLPSGAMSSLGTLTDRLNAIGYSASQDRVYGVAQDGRIVALDRSGRPVPLPKSGSHPLPHATAGAVVGDRLVVRAGGQLYSVDVNPASGTFLEVVRKTWLWPVPDAVTVDDFDLNPADGLLYGVATSPLGAHVVTIDPTSGQVRRVPGTGRLPGGFGYGAAAVGRDGALYATNNRDDGHSTLWRVALDGSGEVTGIVSRQVLRTTDSSGCLSVPPVVDPPGPGPTPIPPTPVPPNPIPPNPTSPAPPGPEPVLPTPTTTTTTTTGEPPTTTEPGPPSSPVQAVKPGKPTFRLPEPRAQTEVQLNRNVRDQRRWGLVAVLLILAAGGLARQHSRRR